MNSRKLVEGAGNFRNQFPILVRDTKMIVNRRHRASVAALSGAPPPGVVDQNAAHRLRGERQKMTPVVYLREMVTHNPQVSFVDQSGRLQRVILSFAGKAVQGKPMQFAV